MTFKDLFKNKIASEVFFIMEDQTRKERVILASEAFIKKMEYRGETGVKDLQYEMISYTSITLSPMDSRQEYTISGMKFTFYADKMEALRTYVNYCTLRIRETNMTMVKRLTANGTNITTIRNSPPFAFENEKKQMAEAIKTKRKLNNKITEAYNLVYSA